MEISICVWNKELNKADHEFVYNMNRDEIVKQIRAKTFYVPEIDEYIMPIAWGSDYGRLLGSVITKPHNHYAWEFIE